MYLSELFSNDEPDLIFEQCLAIENTWLFEAENIKIDNLLPTDVISLQQAAPQVGLSSNFPFNKQVFFSKQSFKTIEKLDRPIRMHVMNYIMNYIATGLNPIEKLKDDGYFKDCYKNTPRNTKDWRIIYKYGEKIVIDDKGKPKKKFNPNVILIVDCSGRGSVYKKRESVETDLIQNALFETRIANENSVKHLLNLIAKDVIKKPNSYNFLTKQIYNILKNDKALYRKPLSSDYFNTEYDHRDAEAGTLVILKTPENIITKINHIADWLRDAPDQTNLRGVQSLDIANAMADAYFAKKNKAVVDNDDLNGLNTIFRDGDYLWVQVISKQALDREGKLMQHCVGSYYEDVQEGNCKIYSLRDKNNQPHCTIEVMGDIVQQIKGKQNAAPIEKYWDTCKKFINYMQFIVENDAKNIGCISINKKLYTIEEFENSNGLKVYSDLEIIDNSNIKKLPDNLVVYGNLDIVNSFINQLPKNLTVDGNLDLDHTSIIELCDNLSVGGNLVLNKNFEFTKSNPYNLFVKNNLFLNGAKVIDFPDTMYVGNTIFGYHGNLNRYPQYNFSNRR